MMSKKRNDGGLRVRPLRLIRADSPGLHGVAHTVEPSEELWQLGQRMIATAIRNNGLAVAAPQVGRNVRLVALRAGVVILNPTIHDVAGEQVGDEGCLSYPNRWWRVPRHQIVYVTGLDARDGSPVGMWSEDLDARMWEHELDHLDGLVLDGRFEEVTEERRRR